MLKIILIALLTISIVTVTACGSGAHKHPCHYFTFGHDFDAEGVSTYGQFSNLYMLSVPSYEYFFTPEFNALMDRVKPLKVFLYLEKALFRNAQLLPEYATNLYKLKSVLAPHMDQIAFLYLIGEPMVIGISNADLKLASDAVRLQFPDSKIALIEGGYPQYLNVIEVPSSVDAFGFDYYGVLNPDNDTEYQLQWTVMKSKLKEHQKIIVVSQAFHCPNSNLTEQEVIEMAKAYQRLFQSDNRSEVFIAFPWIAASDMTGCSTASVMPEVVNAYKDIGEEIIKSN